MPVVIFSCCLHVGWISSAFNLWPETCLPKFNFTKPYANSPIIYMRLIRKSRVPINRLLIELFSTDDDIGINQSVNSEFTEKIFRKTKKDKAPELFAQRRWCRWIVREGGITGFADGDGLTRSS